MEMQRIYFIRHGRTYGNTLGRYIGTTDEPLLEEEAESLSTYAPIAVDAVFSSPMKRCMQTAQILFPHQALLLIKNLRECDFGDFENKNYQELSDNPEYQKWIATGGTGPFPGGESVEEFTERTIKGFEQISRTILERGYENVAVICHGGTIMSLLSSYGFPEGDYFSWQVKNGEGYIVRYRADAFLGGSRQIFVDKTITRDLEDPELEASADAEASSESGFLPGECHAHIFMDGIDYQKARELHRNGPDEKAIREHLAAYERRGIPFIRDGGDPYGASVLAKKIAPEYGITYLSPHFALYKDTHYGKIVGKPFADRMEYRERIKELKEEGADFVKIMTSGIMTFQQTGELTEEAVPGEEVQWMVAIAHDAGLKVMAHTNGAKAVLEACKAGVDSIEHGNFQNKESLEAMKEQDVVWVPTVVTVKNLIGSGRYQDQVLQRILSGLGQNLRYAKRIGIPIALGSDAGAYRVLHGQGILEEYRFFQSLFFNDPTLDPYLQAGEMRIREFHR